MTTPHSPISPTEKPTFMSGDRQLPPLTTQLPDHFPRGAPTSPPRTPDTTSADLGRSPNRTIADHFPEDRPPNTYPTQRATSGLSNNAPPGSLPSQHSEREFRSYPGQTTSLTSESIDPRQGAHTQHPRLPSIQTVHNPATHGNTSYHRSSAPPSQGQAQGFPGFPEGRLQTLHPWESRNTPSQNIQTSDLAQYRISGSNRQLPIHNARPVDRPQTYDSIARPSIGNQQQEQHYLGMQPPYRESQNPFNSPGRLDQNRSQGMDSAQGLGSAYHRPSEGVPQPYLSQSLSPHSQMSMARLGDNPPSMARYPTEPGSAQYSWEAPVATPETVNRRRRGNLPKESTAILDAWFVQHIAYPYPKEEEKQQLQMETGLTMSQISNWFINARRRRRPALAAASNSGGADSEERPALRRPDTG